MGMYLSTQKYSVSIGLKMSSGITETHLLLMYSFLNSLLKY